MKRILQTVLDCLGTSQTDAIGGLELSRERQADLHLMDHCEQKPVSSAVTARDNPDFLEWIQT